METNAEKHIRVREARSYARCIGQGLSMAADHAGVVLRHTWPSVLLCMLLPFPGIIFFMGQVDRLMREWRELDYVPRRKGLEGWKMDACCTVRALTNLCIWFLAVILVVGSAWVAGQMLPHGEWVGMGVLVVMYLALQPLFMTAMEIEYSDKRIGQCLSGFLMGYRHYGSMFAFELLLAILVTTISLPGLLPASITSLSISRAMAAAQAGDTVMMPPMLPLILVAEYLLATLFMLVSYVIETFCSTLFWGSIQAREEEKRVDKQG